LSQHRSPFKASRFTTELSNATASTVGTTEHPSRYLFDGEQRYNSNGYSFQTVSGERIEFDGWATNPEGFAAVTPVDADADDPAAEPTNRRRRGAHRLPAPPTALKGRAAVVAVAAGAVVAAGQAAITATSHPESPSLAGLDVNAEANAAAAATALPQASQFLGTSDATDVSAAATTNGPQVLAIAAPAAKNDYSALLAKGEKFAQDRAAKEAAARRPMYSPFSTGTFTSGFGARWGTLHAGVDLANAIGTPILAVADGEVIEAGPASGFGMWVRLKHADGTVTIYGHIDSATVSKGQHVLAGDEIAKMGNRGFSTGPHCHFEVWLNGSQKVDPLPWLASRGISLGVERD
jgi:murein DD-endopeptidase MepM/ murein hydrolase activator NlpD